MWWLAAVVIGVAGFASVGGCGMMSKPKARGTMTASAPHRSASPIIVDTRNGSIEVVADSSVGEVRVEARIVCEGETQQEADARLAQTVINATRDTTGTLTISPAFSGGSRNGDGASLVVRVPDANGVKVTTSNGTLSLEGLAGLLEAKTSNGAVKILGHQGEVRVDTSNGSVNARDVNGSAFVKTSNGAIDLVLSNDAIGPVTLKSSNGSIRVTVGVAFAGAVAMDTSNGGIDVTGTTSAVERPSKSKARLMLAPGKDSTIETSNGAISFAVRR